MNKHPEIRYYIKEIEKELSDIPSDLKKSIIREINEHLEDKFQVLKSSIPNSEISSEDVKKILEDFGEPKEIASEYKRQLLDENESFPGKKRSSAKVIILFFTILVIIVFVIIAGLLLMVEEEKSDNTIYEGMGLSSIQIGDDLDKVLELYGDPENRVDSGDTIWLGYRENKGIDFLLNNQSKEITEIRFNPGFNGRLGNGISMGQSLNDVLDLSGGSLNSTKINVNEAHNYSHGWDKVLYEIVDDANETFSYKFIDAKKGILFWFDSSGILTQIVVFLSY